MEEEQGKDNREEPGKDNKEREEVEGQDDSLRRGGGVYALFAVEYLWRTGH